MLHRHSARRQGTLSRAAGQRQSRRSRAKRRAAGTGRDGKIPFPKPSYLFAVVAAKLDCRQDSFRTRSGRSVQLQFFVEPGKLDQGDWALDSLKHAMKWDEDTYGLEVDLDQYNIVAVGDFNAGAMENKGLNIFNTKLVLARQDISTDWDFNFIDRTVAHEYFHNWTGNRVTCRDWFQLVAEGRADGVSRAAVCGRPVLPAGGAHPGRAQSAHRPVSRGCRSDGAPGAAQLHTSRSATSTPPPSTARVRSWCGMMHTLVGAEAFREGIDLYFQRHDGQAVTTDELVAAIAGCERRRSRTVQALVRAGGHAAPRRDATATTPPRTPTNCVITQSCPPTPGQPAKLPMHMPLAVGLLDAQGRRNAAEP